MGDRMANFSRFDIFDEDPISHKAAEGDVFDYEEEFVHEHPAIKKAKNQNQDLTVS